MTDTMERGVMKGENLLLYVVCIVMALFFLGLAGLNYFSAGSFITTDSLFFTTVSGLMALIFILVPLASLRAAHKEKKAASSGQLAPAVAERGAIAGSAARVKVAGALPAPVRYADAVDARGRPIPPDVARMVEVMKETETAGS